MSDHCRAGGNSLALSFGRGDRATVVNSTITGQGDCLVEAICDREEPSRCDGTEEAVFLNNIFRGYAEFTDPTDTACLIYDPAGISTGRMDYNLIHNARNSDCPRGLHDLCGDPLFIGDSLASLDAHLRPGSPAIDSGLGVGGLIPAHDLENRLRPWGLQADRGAYEYGSPAVDPNAPGGKPVPAIYLLLRHE